MSTKHENRPCDFQKKMLVSFLDRQVVDRRKGNWESCVCVCELQIALEIDYKCIFSAFLMGKSRTNVDTVRREARRMTHNAVFVLTLTCRPETANRILQQQVCAFVLSRWSLLANRTVRAVLLTCLKSLPYLPDTLLTAQVGTL